MFRTERWCWADEMHVVLETISLITSGDRVMKIRVLVLCIIHNVMNESLSPFYLNSYRGQSKYETLGSSGTYGSLSEKSLCTLTGIKD